MKPTSLKSGMRVLIQPSYAAGEIYHGTFIERVPRQFHQPAYSIIRVDEFAGLGSNDLGDAQYSDHDVSRRISLLKDKA